MNKLLARIVCVVGILVAEGAACAPASEASIDALLTATRAEALMDGMAGSVEQMMRRTTAEMLKGQTLTAEQQRVIDAMATKTTAIVKEELSWARVRPLYVGIYAETFTQEEVDGLLAFYATPAGQAMIAKMPIVMQKSMAISQARLAPLMEKIKAAMDETVAEVNRTK